MILEEKLLISLVFSLPPSPPPSLAYWLSFPVLRLVPAMGWEKRQLRLPLLLLSLRNTESQSAAQRSISSHSSFCSLPPRLDG